MEHSDDMVTLLVINTIQKTKKVMKMFIIQITSMTMITAMILKMDMVKSMIKKIIMDNLMNRIISFKMMIITRLITLKAII